MPERFTPELAAYPGLRSTYYGLANAGPDDALREVVARMWDMALQIEDGNISQAEQVLRQRRIAPGARTRRQRRRDQEVMEQLRAMDVRRLAEEMRKNHSSWRARSTNTHRTSASRI